MDGPEPLGAFRAIVKGRVQGVGFRYNARNEALRRKLTGWVRNAYDGSVEVVCEGDRKMLAAFAAWLEHGPPGANVTGFDFKPTAYTGDYSDFSIKF